jgi:hypothetical protein
MNDYFLPYNGEREVDQNYTNHLRLLWHTYFALQEAQRQNPGMVFLTIPCSFDLEESILGAIKEELDMVEAVNHAS